jgi:hypothetical protein
MFVAPLPALLLLTLLSTPSAAAMDGGAGGAAADTAVAAAAAAAAEAQAAEPKLAHPEVASGGGACEDDWSCSLGGLCTGGKCVCDHWTTGPQCNLLNLAHLERNISSYGLQMPEYHSWGGHAVQGEHGVWNGFFSFMCKHLSLMAWTTASSIVRATAKSIDGPYTVQQMAVQPWAHNAFLSQEPRTKEWLLFHIGTAVAPEAGWSPCVIPNASTPEPKPAPPAPKCPVARTGNLAIRSSQSLLGPWTPLSDDPCSVNGGVNITFGQNWSTFVAGNPAPFVFENGTTLLYFSAQPCPDGWDDGNPGATTCINVARAASWKGPYETIKPLPITSPKSEDPSVFRDARGNFHLLTNINNGHTRCDPSVPCGGHAWSRDGLSWSNLTIGAFGPNQNLANGSVWKNAYVERPQVVQDKAGNPLALFLGMSKLDGYADSVSWSSKFCAKGQDRSQCGPTTACEKGKKGCGCSDIPNPPGSCPLPPAPPPPAPPAPPGPPAPLPPAALLHQYKWSDGRCLTIEPPTCKASYTSPCPLVLGSCTDNASHWAERPPHVTHGATSSAAIDIDCNRQEHGAVAKLLDSSPSSIVWKPGGAGGVGQLQGGGSQFCLNSGEGAPVPPCGLDKALPEQIKLAACANESATRGWTRVVVGV